MWDASGNLSAVKKRAKVELPQDPEALRARITLLGTSWIFAGLQHPNRDYLKDIHPQMFQDYLDYLLGENVYGLIAKSFGGVSGGEPILAGHLELRIRDPSESIQDDAEGRGVQGGLGRWLPGLGCEGAVLHDPAGLGGDGKLQAQAVWWK